VSGVLVEQRDLRHHRVGRQRAGVVGHDQRAAGRRNVTDAQRRHPPPPPVQRPRQRDDQAPGTLLDR
jgi:hypothetical protein